MTSLNKTDNGFWLVISYFIKIDPICINLDLVNIYLIDTSNKQIPVNNSSLSLDRWSQSYCCDIRRKFLNEGVLDYRVCPKEEMSTSIRKEELKRFKEPKWARELWIVWASKCLLCEMGERRWLAILEQEMRKVLKCCVHALFWNEGSTLLVTF